MRGSCDFSRIKFKLLNFAKFNIFGKNNYRILIFVNKVEILTLLWMMAPTPTKVSGSVLTFCGTMSIQVDC